MLPANLTVLCHTKKVRHNPHTLAHTRRGFQNVRDREGSERYRWNCDSSLLV